MENELIRIIKLMLKEIVEDLSDRHTVSVNFMERILAKMQEDEEKIELLRGIRIDLIEKSK